MALSSLQQNKIVQLLGYGGKTIQVGSVIYNKIINDRLQSVPPDTESLVLDYLDSVQAIETQLLKAQKRLIAEKVGDIVLNKDELPDLRRERKRIVREMAALLDIPYQGPNGVNVSVCI